MLIYDCCAKCGEPIAIGDEFFEVGELTYCADCCTPSAALFEAAETKDGVVITIKKPSSMREV